MAGQARRRGPALSASRKNPLAPGHPLLCLMAELSGSTSDAARFYTWFRVTWRSASHDAYWRERLTAFLVQFETSLRFHPNFHRWADVVRPTTSVNDRTQGNYMNTIRHIAADLWGVSVIGVLSSDEADHKKVHAAIRLAGEAKRPR